MGDDAASSRRDDLRRDSELERLDAPGVVEAGFAHHSARELDGLELCNRRDRSGPSHLPVDID